MVITYKTFKITIENDPCPLDPRTDWEPLGVIANWDGSMENECPYRPNIDELIPDTSSNLEVWDNIKAWYISNVNIVAIVPIFKGFGMDGNRYNTKNGKMVGFIYIPRKEFESNFSNTHLDKHYKGLTKGEVARKIMRSEIKTYSQAVNNEVYGYTIDKLEDSCWGYYGDDHEKSDLLNDARSAIDWEINKQTKHHCKRLINMIKNNTPINKRIAYAYS